MGFIIKTSGEPTENVFKKVTFYYHVESKHVYMHPTYFDKTGRFYFPVVMTDPHDIDGIYRFCMAAFEAMVPGKMDAAIPDVDLAKLLGVKTYAGAIRKLEFYSFDWTDWEFYYFCKGKRGVGGYSMFKESIIGETIDEESFAKGYKKCLAKIERRLARKEAKKASGEKT